jgi:hypothetical protein
VSAVLYLVAAAVMSAVLALFYWLHHRQPPRSMESGMQEFAKGLRALAPEGVEDPNNRERRAG